jgi:phosphatidylglycerophosphate synthase
MLSVMALELTQGEHKIDTQQDSAITMTEPLLPSLVIVAAVRDALTTLGGLSLLERLRRIVRQIGFRQATILSNSVELMAAHVGTTPSHTADVSLKLRQHTDTRVTVGDVQDCSAGINALGDRRLLCVFAGFYCDARLLRALIDAQPDSVLVDSNPPSSIAALGKDIGRAPCAALLSAEWFCEKDSDRAFIQELHSDLTTGRVAAIDAAQQENYVSNMRRNLRPVFFPAPSPETRPLAERLLRDTTQKGVLDFPALVHAPVEQWIVSHLCRTSITPNHVTLVAGFLGISVTLLYAFGYLWSGALLALAFGILDGVDGKLARLKVQSTRIGQAEHTLDYCIEMSWWAALAFHFQITGQLRSAYAVWLVFFAFDSVERVAKSLVERRIGRSRDDFSPFDRLVRYVAGRRNIYTWLFTFFLILGAPASGFIWLCFWGVVSAAIHIFRAWQILYAGHDKLASVAS